MSDDEKTNGNIHATGTTPGGAVSAKNIHATSEPLTIPNPLKADEEAGEAGTDNIHATDEKA